MAPLPLTSRTTASVPASASRQAASTRKAPLGSEELSTPTLTTSRSPCHNASQRCRAACWNFPKSACVSSLSVMVAPSGDRMMRVPPTAPCGDGAADCLVEFLGSQIAEEVGVKLADRRLVAYAETAVHDLDGQFAVRRCIAVGDSPDIFQILDEPLRTHDVTGHAMAEQHEVHATRLGAKVGVERQESIDASRGGAEVMGYDLGGVHRHPAEMLIDFL